MFTLVGLLALWLVPIVAFYWARRRAPGKTWRLAGFSLGLVVSPACSGLYALYFVGPLAALLGLVGLPLMMFHGSPGFDLATTLGLREPRTVVHGVEHIYIALLNAGVWSVTYGALGWLLDIAAGVRRQRRKPA